MAVTVALTDYFQEFVEQQAAAHGLGSPADDIATLVEAASREAARKRLEGLLLEGLNSGPPIEVNEAFWADLKREVHERHPQGVTP